MPDRVVISPPPAVEQAEVVSKGGRARFQLYRLDQLGFRLGPEPPGRQHAAAPQQEEKG